MHAGSTASGLQAKPRAAEAARAALIEHLERTGVGGTVELGPLAGWYRVRPAIERWARVAILLPMPAPPSSAAGQRAFSAMVRAWSLSEHPGVELFLAGSGETLRRCAEGMSLPPIEAGRIRFCEVGPGRHWTELINAAGREADSELLLVSPAAIGPLNGAWWEQLVGLARQPELAAAGGTLLGPHGEIDRGAVIFGDGWPLQVARGRRDFAYPFLLGNFRALNGPLAIRTALFESLGGLDRELGELAIADLCLRAGDRGLPQCSVGRPASAPRWARPRPRRRLCSRPSAVAGARSGQTRISTPATGRAVAISSPDRRSRRRDDPGEHLRAALDHGRVGAGQRESGQRQPCSATRGNGPGSPARDHPPSRDRRCGTRDRGPRGRAAGGRWRTRRARAAAICGSAPARRCSCRVHDGSHAYLLIR